MHILCVGLSHKTAAVAIREKVTLDEAAATELLSRWRDLYPQAEMAVLSTCNRTEFYVARPLHGHPRVEEVIGHLAERAGVAPESIAELAYHHENERAVRHLLRVASGIESMVLGEGQIMSQVRAAYEMGRRAGTLSKTLHRVFQAALRTAKQVRHQTNIGAGRLSVASVAVDFARHLFSRMDDKTVLTIGAGKMAELTLRHFMAMQPGRLLVCNRSAERAAELAERFGGTAVGYESLDDHLIEADVVISSTGSAQPIVTAERFRPLVRRRRFRPLFVIDIALPRDFEPAVGELTNVYLYDLDDLHRAMADHAGVRAAEVEACERIIDPASAACYAEVQNTDFSDLIRQLRQQMHALGREEVDRIVHRMRQADDDQVDALLEQLVHRLINKILHRPLSELSNQRAAAAAMYATALRRLFDLDATEDLDEPEHNVLPETRREQTPVKEEGF